jgi:hypothetical protein
MRRVAGIFRRTYLLYFSQPAIDRPLLRAIRKRTIRSVVELGIGSLSRTQRILEIARWRPESEPIRYCGIDLFDARDSERPQLALKQAFADLQASGAKLQLVPGSPGAALKRVANSLTHTDLLLIDASHDADSLATAWTWIPRMLAPESLVYWQQAAGKDGQLQWRQLSILEIQQFAASTGKLGRRAA